jgi:AAA domain, putative AbiEii toxin, Type IV TA system
MQHSLKLYFGYRSSSELHPPYVRLMPDNWDDFGYKTSFNAWLKLADDEKETDLGGVKILKLGEVYTRITGRHEALGHDFCSLGQTLAYYERLDQLKSEDRVEILSKLRDVTYDRAIRSPFADDPGFERSLLRFSEAQAVYDARVKPQTPKLHFKDRKLQFEFRCRVEGAAADHRIKFDLHDQGLGLSRISAFIGRNGTGKTQVLAQLAYALSGYKDEEEAGTFDERPPFSAIIALSYSAFDDFEIPTRFPKGISYKYCGIRKLGNQSASDGKQRTRLMTLDGFVRTVGDGLKDVYGRDRFGEWKRAIDALLAGSHVTDGLTNNRPRRDWVPFRRLSAGHRLTVLAVTEIVRHIELNSFLLIDEPETHLHPDLLSGFIAVLRGILETYDSYAVIATHSTIALQEVPSRHVHVFERQGRHPIVRSLEHESFGENLSTITNLVFGLGSERQNYRGQLRRLAEEHTYGEVLALFDGQLSLNAKAFLDAVYDERG